jgi:glycosyltransferase involved in cell wall biosynthesis
MALGKPVVASAAGGNPELVEDGVSGLLVPPRDPGALAESVARLLQDHELAARLARAGQQRVRRDFSTEVRLDRIEALYAELTAGGARTEG